MLRTTTDLTRFILDGFHFDFISFNIFDSENKERYNNNNNNNNHLALRPL